MEGFGSVLVTNGSGCGSGRPKNIRIIRIQIHNIAIKYSTAHSLVLTKILVANHLKGELKYLLELGPQVFRHRLSNICSMVYS
jgi:hypothetical protein